MNKQIDRLNKLRTKAETQLARAPETDEKQRPVEELLHELQVYQVELEMQNEALREAQVELEKSRDRYVDFYDFSPVGYLTLNSDVMIDEINHTGTKLLGSERSKLLHRRFPSFISLEYRERWDRHFMSVLAHDSKDICELLIQRQDGSTFFAQLHCLRLKKNDNKSAVRVVLTDITDRKLAEVNLHIASVAFEANECMMITDASGVILRVNQAFMHTTGYTSEQAVGQTPNQLGLILHTSDFYSAMWEDVHRTGIWHGEVWGKRKNGETYPTWLTISAVRGTEETPTHYVVAYIDITELSDAKIAAEKANRAKSQFLSSMSHELRTPLNAILGFAQLLEQSSPVLTPTQMVELKEIIRGGWYLLELINEILDLASIESGNLSLHPEYVSLHDILFECKTMMEPQAKLRDIQMNVHEPDPSLVVYADRTRIKQILINLLSNAIKYNCDHGSIEVTCNINILKRVCICVKDTGVGLSLDKIAQLFQPFNRLGQENSTVEGTGIGLVLAKKLVEQMGGTIGVKSNLGAGSEFSIELPLAGNVN